MHLFHIRYIFKYYCDIHRENESAEPAAINTVCKPRRLAGGFFISEFAPISLTKPFQKEWVRVVNWGRPKWHRQAQIAQMAQMPNTDGTDDWKWHRWVKIAILCRIQCSTGLYINFYLISTMYRAVHNFFGDFPVRRGLHQLCPQISRFFKSTTKLLTNFKLPTGLYQNFHATTWLHIIFVGGVV